MVQLSLSLGCWKKSSWLDILLFPSSSFLPSFLLIQILLLVLNVIHFSEFLVLNMLYILKDAYNYAFFPKKPMQSSKKVCLPSVWLDG